jgi:hypothetical protein
VPITGCSAPNFFLNRSRRRPYSVLKATLQGWSQASCGILPLILCLGRKGGNQVQFGKKWAKGQVKSFIAEACTYIWSKKDILYKSRGKGHPRIGHEGPEGEQRYGSTLPLTSALDGVGGQHHAPAALPPRKAQYPLYRKLGGPQGRSGQVRKISPPTGIRSPDRPARSQSLYQLSYPAHPEILGSKNLRAGRI